MLDSLVARQGGDEAQKAALLATKSELEQAKKELAEKQARGGGRAQMVERLAALEAESAALRERIKSNTTDGTEKDEPAAKKQSGTNPEKTASEAENRPQTKGRKTRPLLLSKGRP